MHTHYKLALQSIAYLLVAASANIQQALVSPWVHPELSPLVVNKVRWPSQRLAVASCSQQKRRLNFAHESVMQALRRERWQAKITPLCVQLQVEEHYRNGRVRSVQPLQVRHLLAAEDDGNVHVCARDRLYSA
jgi:hypothetical protein